MCPTSEDSRASTILGVVHLNTRGRAANQNGCWCCNNHSGKGDEGLEIKTGEEGNTLKPSECVVTTGAGACFGTKSAL
jgi:hypothetical protein